MPVSPFWTTDVRIISPGWDNRTRSIVPNSSVTELLGSIATVDETDYKGGHKQMTTHMLTQLQA